MINILHRSTIAKLHADPELLTSAETISSQNARQISTHTHQCTRTKLDYNLYRQKFNLGHNVVQKLMHI